MCSLPYQFYLNDSLTSPQLTARCYDRFVYKAKTTTVDIKMLDKGIFFKHNLLNDEERLMTYKIKSIFLTYNGLISSIKSYSKVLKNNISIIKTYET